MPQSHEQIGAPGDMEGGSLYKPNAPSEEQLAKLHPAVLKFAGFVFTREWGNVLTPEGFVLSAKLALNDLEHGFDTMTGQPVEGLFASLACQPSVVYYLLNREIPTIGDLFFHPDIARDIRECWSQVDHKGKEEPPLSHSS